MRTRWSEGSLHISTENKCERRKADAFYRQSVHTVLKRTWTAIYFQTAGSMQIPTELNVNLKEMASIKDKTTQRGNWELNHLIKNFTGSAVYLKSMTQMSSVFSKDVSGHVEKMSFRVWHLECLSVTMEKYISMVCIDFQMIRHQKASSVHLSCS